ncbi:hypothetical protein CSV71_05530 [Sporosarcina sp. P21c]|uniref:GOLPH3/VPS74 family protein n=1 Tax=unclassified Sporosarcina TaxID=2647733 RepID=UPI000C16DE7E|nr:MULTISPECIES: GPP34 family phosphoprotein [unclassified Sporosarcina]PIC66198.1 hypothetical protein CSV78_13570 [Sporosarcina sp. P16a]PIC90165.1 hypothetical protein CSV71_05530 [Sporosarcina sp. P21c]PIC91908.1 hypothetical protein CSV70_13490 [Sporosarcina sp. P25]
MAELALNGYIELRNSKIEVVDSSTEDPLLKETLDIIKAKPLKIPKQWISTLRTSHKNIQYKIATKLDDDGVITMETKRILGAVPAYFYKFNPDPFVKEAHKSFHKVIQKNKKQSPLVKEERTIVLMSLIYASSLLRIVFPNSKEAGEAEKQIKQLNKDLPISSAVKATIDSINMSIFASSAYFSNSY